MASGVALALNPNLKLMKKSQFLLFIIMMSVIFPVNMIINPFLRIPVTITSLGIALLLFGHLNLNQATWLSVITMALSFITDIVASQLMDKPFEMMLSDNLGASFAGFSIILMMLFSFASILVLILRKSVHRLIENKTYIKKYQITFSLVTLVTLIIIILFLLLTSPDFYYGHVHPALFVSFFIAIIAVSIMVIFMLDKYFKKAHELKLIRHKMRLEQGVAQRRTPFEESIEFELFNLDFEELFSDQVDIHDAIYKGPNSEVYLLTNKVIQQSYTLKAIQKQDGIPYNFDIIKDLKHPHIAKVIKWREGRKYYFIVKEYIEGNDAYSHVRKGGAFSLADALKIIHQLCNALSYLHKQHPPLICRDVKPSNIILDDRLRVSLIDIETLRRTSEHSDTDTFIVGTKGYAAPEQYGFSQTTILSDVFGIGATLFFLLTGEEPDYKKITTLHERDDLDIPKSVIEIIQKCMKFSPDDRYQSVDALVATLINIS